MSVKITTFSKADLKGIARLKSLAFILQKNKQIPYKLYVLILEVDKHDIKYLNSLKALTEDLLRVKGYYQGKRIEIANLAIAEWLNNNMQSV